MSASVSLATRTARVRYDPEAVGARDLLAVIQVLTSSGPGPPVFKPETQQCSFLFQDLGFQAELVRPDRGLKENLDHSEEIQQ